MITHDLLLMLGFSQHLFTPDRYEYYGIKGRLAANGQFYFDGFSMGIEKPEDLQFMVVMIDQPPTDGGTPFSDN